MDKDSGRWVLVGWMGGHDTIMIGASAKPNFWHRHHHRPTTRLFFTPHYVCTTSWGLFDMWKLLSFVCWSIKAFIYLQMYFKPIFYLFSWNWNCIVCLHCCVESHELLSLALIWFCCIRGRLKSGCCDSVTMMPHWLSQCDNVTLMQHWRDSVTLMRQTDKRLKWHCCDCTDALMLCSASVHWCTDTLMRQTAE